MPEPLCYLVGGIYDPQHADLSGPCGLVVEGGRITAIDADGDFAGTTLDFRDLIAMPGLIDAHTHLSIATPGDESSQVARPVVERVLLAAGYMRAMLAEGVTSIRVLGEPDFFDLRVRAAIEQGLLAGPRMFVAGRIVAPTHALLSILDRPADGADVVVRVRENLARGVDWIKLYATGSSLRADPREAYFSAEEIDLATATAARAGTPVAAHAHGGPAIDDCLDAGVTTIEHGRFLSDAQLERMARQKTVLCPTVGINVRADMIRSGVDEQAALARSEQAVARALQAGVTVIPGTDAVHGGLRFELRALEHYGASRAEALKAATATAASVLGRGGDLGRLVPGAAADFALLEADPTSGSRLPEAAVTCVAGDIAWRVDQPSTDPLPARDRVTDGGAHV